MCREVEVDMDYIEKVKEYWDDVIENTSGSIAPQVKEGTSPVYNWECKYCNFLTYCQEN